MTWYDADLRKEGVQELNRVFNDDHFSNRKDQDKGTEVFYKMDGKETAIMSYDEGRIIIYHSVIDNFPRKVQDDIEGRLVNIKSLERVMERLHSGRR